jgi:metal-sulfur cluster biosynthetic enzyme
MDDTNVENNPIWDVENTHPDFIPAIEDSLSQVMDPELGLNILQLGLIRNIKVDNNKALVTMILTTPYCPYGPSLMESARKKVEKVLDIPTDITYGKESWDPTMMEDGLNDDWGLY